MPPSTPPPPTVSNPLRILVLTTSPSTPLPPLLQGSDLPIQTPYYTATIPIWHDTISSLAEWSEEWSAPEAGEVIQSIGAWIVVVRKPSSADNRGEAGGGRERGSSVEHLRNTLSAIHRLLSHHQSTSGNYTPLETEPPLLLAIGMPQPLRPLLPITPEEWEDLCRECGGWEWIDGEATGKNEFGENVGRERLKEALEANEWDGGGGGIFNANDIDTEELESELGLLDDGSPTPRGIIDVRSDFAGMHEAILGQSEDVANDDDPGGGGDIQVEELEGMMLKMQAIKEKGAGMPEDERKRFAAKAVNEVMRSVKSFD